jgi:hypothetical protein
MNTLIIDVWLEPQLMQKVNNLLHSNTQFWGLGL